MSRVLCAYSSSTHGGCCSCRRVPRLRASCVPKRLNRLCVSLCSGPLTIDLASVGYHEPAHVVGGRGAVARRCGVAPGRAVGRDLAPTNELFPCDPTPACLDGSRYRPWAKLLSRTFGIDVETCPALRRTHAPLGRHHRPRSGRALSSALGRADRAALGRCRSRPTELAEQDCTTTRPIRAVLARGCSRSTEPRLHRTRARERVAAPTRATGRRFVRAAARRRSVAAQRLRPHQRSPRSPEMRSGTGWPPDGPPIVLPMRRSNDIASGVRASKRYRVDILVSLREQAVLRASAPSWDGPRWPDRRRQLERCGHVQLRRSDQRRDR